MAMFRHKQKIAIKFSKTLTDHFSVSKKIIIFKKRTFYNRLCFLCHTNVKFWSSFRTLLRGQKNIFPHQSKSFYPLNNWNVSPSIQIFNFFNIYVYISFFRTAENPSPSVPSPASSGPSSNHSGSSIAVDGATVAIPQNIEQMAFSYVNITSLFVSAHDLWEQAEELAQKGSGKNENPSSSLASLHPTLLNSDISCIGINTIFTPCLKQSKR